MNVQNSVGWIWIQSYFVCIKIFSGQWFCFVQTSDSQPLRSGASGIGIDDEIAVVQIFDKIGIVAWRFAPIIAALTGKIEIAIVTQTRTCNGQFEVAFVGCSDIVDVFIGDDFLPFGLRWNRPLFAKRFTRIATVCGSSIGRGIGFPSIGNGRIAPPFWRSKKKRWISAI